MPIYEFECDQCGCRFEDLLASEAAPPPCPECGSAGAMRLISPVSPPGRQPRGAAVKSDESKRGEREAAHKERLARDKTRRAKGELG
jgi:putative FmdB family regulatory protein